MNNNCDNNKIYYVIALLVLLFSSFYILFCATPGSNKKYEPRSPHLPSMSNIRLVHHDLIRKYQCLANVPKEEILDLESQGYKIIEIDYEKNGAPAKLIIIYEEI